MGIGGSGMSGVALLAKHQGFKVTGCDLEKETAYFKQLKEAKIPTFIGHDPKHLEDVDFLVTSPAVLFQSSKHPEVEEARKLKMQMTWQKFLGNYLHKDKKVICIAGTHGKSTTTALVSLLFEDSGSDPNSMIGALVPKWKASYRVGDGDLFITEADEFYDNFLNYKPEYIIVNNVELDHPDYFKTEAQMYESFEKFIKRLVGKKVLIVNQDSPGIRRLFRSFDRKFLNSLDCFGYTLEEVPTLMIERSLRGNIIKTSQNSTVFKASSEDLRIDDEFKLKIAGVHNVYNALGVVILGKLFKIKNDLVKKSLSSFSGLGRRMEFLGSKMGVRVYDDYAHHPTAIRETLKALRQKYPRRHVWAVIEPHSFSRTKALLSDYEGVFDQADSVVIGPIFKARDVKTFGITGRSIVEVANHKSAVYKRSFEGLIAHIKSNAKPDDVILVMGAGKSYKWAQEILNKL
jgi:UDP-N-acetylmuramate--alanine ligase